MTNGDATVHISVGIPLMTDAALVRTMIEFKQQLSLASTGALDMTTDLQNRIIAAVEEIESELRDREIDPDELHPGSVASFNRANIVRYVSLDDEI